MKRNSRIISEVDAATIIKDGMTVYIGGFSLSSHPMAIVRQILRNKTKDLTVVGAATASIEIDMLIAAGAVKKVITSYIGIEGHAPMGPFYRAAAQSGELNLWEIDESGFYAALRAGSFDLPFMPDRVQVGTDYTKLNPDLKLITDPFGGKPLVAVPAVKPDVALIYVAASDEFGNVRFTGSGFGDRTAVRASSICIAQAEKIISNEEIRMNPQATSIHGVNYIVRAPFGAHPFSSPGNYLQDNEIIKAYAKAGDTYLRTKDRTLIDNWLNKWVYEPQDHMEYLDRVGVKKLFSLNEY